MRLLVGISDALPKLIAYRLLQPALAMGQPIRLVCHEDKPDRLLAELSSHNLDMVLTDSPLTAATRVRAFNHLLGSCGVTLFASDQLASVYRKDFPRSLEAAPFLLPLENVTLRRSLENWFEANGIHPTIVGEFQDNALIGTFGQAGVGVFAAPSAIEKEVRSHYRVKIVGHLESIVESFYAISIERKLKHPAAVAISEAARADLFRSDSAMMDS